MTSCSRSLALVAFGLAVGSAHSVEAQLSATGTAVIDGTKSPGEWDDAATLSVLAGSYSGSILYLMNDTQNLYAAVEVQGDADLTTGDGATLRFDDDLDAVLTQGDDRKTAGGFGFGDGHYDTAIGWSPDLHGDGQGAVARSGGINFLEFAIPLSSGDGDDFDLAAGDQSSLCLVYKDNGTSGGSMQHPFECNLLANQQSQYELFEIAAPAVPGLSTWGVLWTSAALIGLGIASARRLRSASTPGLG